MEFARQFRTDTKIIISLDGSWITRALCARRLLNWKSKGKIVKKIKTQSELDYLVDQIKNNKDNDIFINQIFDYVRYAHTIHCIKYNFENLIKKNNFIIFRDINSNCVDKIMVEYNKYAIEEHNILVDKNSSKYKIFWLVDASHEIYLNPYYRN